MAAGDITQDLMDQLGLRLEDADSVKFTPEAKLKALSGAQIRLCNLLHDGYLTELQKMDSAIDASSQGIINLSTLNSGNGVLRGAEGILKVRVNIGDTNLKWATEIDIQEIKKTQNSYLAGSDSNPLYFVFQDQINILITTYTSTTANVYYFRIPPALTTSVDPIINSGLYHLMLDFAESECWKMDNKHDRATEARGIAIEEIKVMNEKYTKPEGIGTDNRKRMQ